MRFSPFLALALVIGAAGAAASAFAQQTGVRQELERNLGLARQLGINGTPAWSIGGKLLTGAVGREALQQAVDAARKG